MRTSRAVLGIFLFSVDAILLGQLALHTYADVTGIAFHLGGNAQDGYLELARNLVAGHGFVFDPGGPPVLHRPPAYPFLLALLVAVAGSVLPLAVLVLNALLVGGIAAIAFANAQLWFDLRTSRIASILVLLCPWLQYNVKNPAAGIFVGFLYALFFTLTLWWASRPRRSTRSEALAGLGIGAIGAALLLSHGVMQIAVPGLLAAATLWAIARRARGHALAFGIALAVAICGVVPWTIRNYEVSGRFVPIASNNGAAYFMGHYHWESESLQARGIDPNAEGTLRAAGLDPALQDRFRFSGSLDGDLDRELSSRMWVHALENPGALLRKMGLNLAEFYFPIVWELAHARELRKAELLWWLRAATSVYFALLWAAVLWAFAHRRPRQTTAFAAQGIGVAMHVLPFLPFLVFGTYSLATVPLIAVMAAPAVRRSRILAQLRIRSRSAYASRLAHR